MLSQIKRVLENRENAGRLLAGKLNAYKNSDTVVLAVPYGGIPVGYQLATALHLPFEIIFSKRIKHPANSDLCIGAVTKDEVVLHDSAKFIPRDYISHQISQLQHRLKKQYSTFYPEAEKNSLDKKTVILVDDVLRDREEISVCLRSIEKQNVDEVILAVPVVTDKKTHNYLSENYKLVYLFSEWNSPNKIHTYFSEEAAPLEYLDNELIARG